MEGPDRRLHLAGELLEDQVLVLHLGDEAGRLEQPLAVSRCGFDAVGELPLGQRRDAGRRGVVQQHALDVVDQPVVLGVEDWWIAVSPMFSLHATVTGR